MSHEQKTPIKRDWETPQLKQMTPAYNPERVKETLLVIDEDIVICIIGQLSRIQASIQMANNYRFMSPTPIPSSKNDVYMRNLAKLEECLDALKQYL